MIYRGIADCLLEMRQKVLPDMMQYTATMGMRRECINHYTTFVQNLDTNREDQLLYRKGASTYAFGAMPS